MLRQPVDSALFAGLTTRENLLLALPPRRRRRGGDRLVAALQYFPKLTDLLDRKAGLLSGGEQQMLALARALVADPRLLMVDELSLGLAPIIVEQVLPVMRTIAEETGAGVLLVEQHVPMALSIADRAYVMTHGEIVAEGPASELREQAELLRASYLGETLA